MRERGDSRSELASRDGRGLLRHHKVGCALDLEAWIEPPGSDRGEVVRRERDDEPGADLIEQVGLAVDDQRLPKPMNVELGDDQNRRYFVSGNPCSAT